jgi:GTPase SAR1 family protein
VGYCRTRTFSGNRILVLPWGSRCNHGIHFLGIKQQVYVQVYDVTSKDTLHNISDWLAEIQRHASENIQMLVVKISTRKFLLYFFSLILQVGNKSDLLSKDKMDTAEINSILRGQEFKFKAVSKQRIDHCFSLCSKHSERINFCVYEFLKE